MIAILTEILWWTAISCFATAACILILYALAAVLCSNPLPPTDVKPHHYHPDHYPTYPTTRHRRPPP